MKLAYKTLRPGEEYETKANETIESHPRPHNVADKDGTLLIAFLVLTSDPPAPKAPDAPK